LLNTSEILKNYRIVFLGSSQFSIPILSAVHENCQLVGIVTQPDKPAGRGRNLRPSVVKEYAIKHAIPSIEPRKIREEPEVIEVLKGFNADVFVVAAYGQILPQIILELPRYGCINVHASLLPRWRGASPIQAAILHGDLESGVTIMKMDAGMDTGPILKSASIAVVEKETTESLSQKLSELGKQLLLDVLPDYLAGRLVATPQDDELATYAPLIKKEDGLLHPNQPVEMLERKVRALNPWPGTYLEWKGKSLKVFEVEILPSQSRTIGKKGIFRKYPTIDCIGGTLLLKKVQLPGRKVVSGIDFLNGVRDWADS